MKPTLRTSPRPPRNGPAEDRIVTGARRHFFAHGFRGVTMSDLAEELGMSKKTLYAHFRSKDALVEAALTHKFRDIEADLNAAAEGDADFPEVLGRSLACVRRHTEEITPAFQRDVRRSAPALFQFIQKRRREVVLHHFDLLFKRGRRTGMVRDDIPVILMLEILLGATDAVMNPQKMAELGLTPRTGFPAIISTVLRGVLTDRGRKVR